MSQENVEQRTPRTLRAAASVVLGIAALPFLVLAVAFPISAVFSEATKMTRST